MIYLAHTLGYSLNLKCQNYEESLNRHSFVRSLTHSLIHSFSHLFIHSYYGTICLSLYIKKKNYGRNDPRAKRPTGETTHLIRAKRPTPKTRAKRPRAKRHGETTHGRNDPDSNKPFCLILS